jgi:hypothetical protein
VKDTKRGIFIRAGSASCTFEKRVKEHKAAARFTTMSSKKYHFYNAYPRSLLDLQFVPGIRFSGDKKEDIQSL